MLEVFSAACTTRQLGDGGGSIPPMSAEASEAQWGATSGAVRTKIVCAEERVFENGGHLRKTLHWRKA